ncbi:hypothetical protein B7P43_G04456 [Cryptotermes secundus]|uniref:Uncharacterized protein n=1 Tax=Cryptotermes secundus TaxID=105785 RepID=A0A2J7QBZ4_9NEOP|nr:hypothetical protein B7P43_G04456 [Cryptotermes secundus]
MSYRHYNKKKCKDQKEHHGYKIGTWNVRSVLGVTKVQWKGQGEIRSGDYTVYYSGGEWAERGVAIVVHKSVVRSVVKKIVCNDRIIALKLKAEPVDILIMQVYMPTSEYEDDEAEKVYDAIEEILQEDGRELYDRPNRPETLEVEPEEEVDTDEKGPYILQSEVEKAIKEMRKGKATGDDDVPADVLKLLGEGGLKTLTKLMNTIYETVEWPKDFTEVTMIENAATIAQ